MKTPRRHAAAALFVCLRTIPTFAPVDWQASIRLSKAPGARPCTTAAAAAAMAKKDDGLLRSHSIDELAKIPLAAWVA